MGIAAPRLAFCYPRRMPQTWDYAAERSEFEPQVPVSKLSDDNVVLICDAEMSCLERPKHQCWFGATVATFKGTFSGMRHTATDSEAGFQREAAPFWLRRFQRQKLKRARNAVRGNNASQPVSIAKPSMMLSYDSLETGTCGSNSLRSANESSTFGILWIDERNPRMEAASRSPFGGFRIPSLGAGGGFSPESRNFRDRVHDARLAAQVVYHERCFSNPRARHPAPRAAALL
jgi:hypothetical protein